MRGSHSTIARPSGRVPAALLLVGAPLVAALAPRVAGAQVLERFTLRGEAGAGSMLSTHQRTELGYGLALQGSARLGFSLLEPLAVQLTYSNWMFPSERGAGQAMLVGGGVRVEPALGTGRVFLDVNAGLGISGNDRRVMGDVGLGFEFEFDRWLGLGPVLRYGRLFTQDGDVRSDPQFWSVGLSISLRVPRREPESAPELPRPVPEPAPLPPPDTDRDGVLDAADQCVTTPQGEHPDPERPGCPDGDDDGDGVLNHADQCRTQHQGTHPDPARAGCPLPDRDGDSVPDPTDHCPDEPGAPHPDPSRNGCPGLVRVESGRIRINRPVFFATNRDRILPQSFPVLQAVADALRASPEIRKVSVEGHTDSQGNDARNLDLSQRRAASVMQWLVQNGIEPGRLEARGFGETQPVASNATSAGRAENRRVEFRIVDPPQPPATEPPPAPDPHQGEPR